MLFLKKGICPGDTFGLSIDMYINVSYTIGERNKSVCYILYQSGADYHLSIDCLSLDRGATCEIYSQEAIMTGSKAQFCRANSSCSSSFEDGLVVSVSASETQAVVSALRLFEVKGKHSQDKCNASLLDSYNASGRRPFHPKDIIVNCNKPPEPVILAVVLIASLLLILTLAVIICFKCRPNREVYVENDDTEGEVKHVRQRGNDGVGSRPVVVSDTGYEKRDLFMPLCD
jgi:hypothetical protein